MSLGDGELYHGAIENTLTFLTDVEWLELHKEYYKKHRSPSVFLQKHLKVVRLVNGQPDSVYNSHSLERGDRFTLIGRYMLYKGGFVGGLPVYSAKGADYFLIVRITNLSS